MLPRLGQGLPIGLRLALKESHRCSQFHPAIGAELAPLVMVGGADVAPVETVA